jgi:hypothetical protein
MVSIIHLPQNVTIDLSGFFFSSTFTAAAPFQFLVHRGLALDDDVAVPSAAFFKASAPAFNKAFPSSFCNPAQYLRNAEVEQMISVGNLIFFFCHTRFSEGNQVHTYMHARIKFHAYSDI